MVLDENKIVAPVPPPVPVGNTSPDNVFIHCLDSDDERDWSDGDSDSSIVIPHHHSRPMREDVIELGSQCEIKTLYEGPKKCKCCINVSYFFF